MIPLLCSSGLGDVRISIQRRKYTSIYIYIYMKLWLSLLMWRRSSAPLRSQLWTLFPLNPIRKDFILRSLASATIVCFINASVFLQSCLGSKHVALLGDDHCKYASWPPVVCRIAVAVNGTRSAGLFQVPTTSSSPRHSLSCDCIVAATSSQIVLPPCSFIGEM